MISRRALVGATAVAPLVSLLPRAALAAYPDKPIRLIVPFAAGGNADFVARLCGEGMQQSLGQPIVVEYRTGAGGSLGADMAAHSPRHRSPPRCRAPHSPPIRTGRCA